MTSSNQKLRTAFQKPVSELLTQARVFQLNVAEDQAALQAVNPSITPAWVADFLTQIEAAEHLTQPSAGIAAVAVATDAVRPVQGQARDSVQELYFYVGSAWPGSRARLAAYGQVEYAAARMSGWRMVKLMEKALTQCTEDAAELEAVGFSAAKRVAFEALMNDLEVKILEQDAQKSAARLVTEEYYLAANGLWGRMVVLQRAAQIAFSGSYANRKKYRLYGGKKTSVKKKENFPLEDAVQGVEGVAAGRLVPGEEG